MIETILDYSVGAKNVLHLLEQKKISVIKKILSFTKWKKD